MFRWLLLGLMALLISAAVAQSDDIYTDPDAHFVAPVPAGWTNTSTEAMAHFVSPDEAVDIYVLAVDGTNVDDGIASALAMVEPGFSAEPLQSVQAPLSNGTWTQNIYIVDEELVVALGQTHEEVVVVMIVRGEQAALQAVNPIVLSVVNGITFPGVPEAVPPYADQQAFEEREVTVGAEGWPLPGTFTMPETDGPVAAVVLVHGSGPNDRDESLGSNKMFRDLAWGLASQGIAVLRYDKRTFVYSGEALSDEGFTLDDETVDDALAAVEFLRSVEGIAADRIFVAGHSLGGMLAPRIGERDSEIAGLILLAGNARPFEVILAEQIAYQRELAAEAGEEVVEQASAALDALGVVVEQLEALRAGDNPEEVFDDPAQAAYWSSLVAYDQVATAQDLMMPMLILQGGRDYQVTMVDFELWQEVLAGRVNVTFESYQALNHMFAETGEAGTLAVPSEYYAQQAFVDEAVIDDIAAWIKAQQ